MLVMKNLTSVSECTIRECAHNTCGSCQAMTITIGDGVRPACINFRRKGDIFLKLMKREQDVNVASVGTCTISSCGYNADFTCEAPDIKVGDLNHVGSCLSFVQN